MWKHAQEGAIKSQRRSDKIKNLNRKSDLKFDNRRICGGSFRIKRLVD